MTSVQHFVTFEWAETWRLPVLLR